MADTSKQAPAGKGSGAVTPDPFADWTDEERADWEAGEKFRKRHADDVASLIFDRIFGEEEGGAKVGPEGGGEKPPGTDPKAGIGNPTIPSSGKPWFERKLFERKPKPAA